MTKASDNEYPSVLFAEQGSAPTTPASGKWRLFTKSDGLYLVDDAGAVTGPFAAAAASTYYAPPTVTNLASQFSSGSTSCAVTVSAPTTGDKLVAIVYATGRGANSITQTNVTWTKRYSGNGNSQYLEVWTGVCSGTGGTTATAAFTGSNSQYVEVFTVNSAASAFTAATGSATATGTTALATVSATGLTPGAYVIVACSAGQASSYGAVSQGYIPITAFGGFGRSGILRLNGASLSYWSLSAGANNFFTAIITLS